MRVSIKTAIVAAVTAIALVPGVAQAQSYDHIDAAGDMFDLSGVPLPTVTNGDIVGLSVNYTKKSLTLVTTLTAIDTSGTNGLGWVADVSSKKRHYTIGVGADASGVEKIYRQGHSKKKCRKMTATVDPVAMTITAVVPSNCVNSKKNIQIMLMGTSTDGTVAPDGTPNLALDDAFLTGGDLTTFGISPVIKRGGTGVVLDPLRTVKRTSPAAKHLVKVALRHF